MNFLTSNFYFSFSLWAPLMNFLAVSRGDVIGMGMLIVYLVVSASIIGSRRSSSMISSSVLSSGASLGLIV